jgi:endonuclease/exonuclease/phosphatase family metal-dependent hydrolase
MSIQRVRTNELQLICRSRLLVFFLPAFILFTGPAPAHAAEPSLQVMTINLWHKDRPHELKVMGNYLRTSLDRLPDFILCQEIVFDRSDDELSSDTAMVLARQLGLHSKGTQRKSDREGVAIISRYPFLYYDELHLKSQTSRLLLGFNRVSVMGEFFVPKIGRVRVVNVHFTNWKFEHHIRAKQLAQTMRWIEERQAKVHAAVTFFGGDFNAERHWNEMKPLDEIDAKGALMYEDFNTTDPSMGKPGKPNRRIDFIFVAGGRLDFVGEKILFKDRLIDGDSDFYLSDHVAVLHHYNLKGAGAVSLGNAALK